MPSTVNAFPINVYPDRLVQFSVKFFKIELVGTISVHGRSGKVSRSPIVFYRHISNPIERIIGQRLVDDAVEKFRRRRQVDGEVNDWGRKTRVEKQTERDQEPR